MKSLRYILRHIWVPVAVLVGWDLAVRTGAASSLLLPPPLEVASSGWELLRNGQLPRHVLVSLVRVAEGFGLAALLGIIVGAAIGLWSFVSDSLDWLFQTLKPIPPIGWFPLTVLWFGIGEVSKVFIIFLGAFFPILINVVDGIRQTDRRYVELAKVHEIGWWKFLRRVLIPGALPSVLTGLRVGLALAWTCVVAAELIATESGIGFLIVDARQTFRPDIVIVGMATIGVLGTLMDLALRRLDRKLVPWKHQFAGTADG